jgi:hypothetical protein
MVFKYRAITANCGNDSIGTEASRIIMDTISPADADAAADFVVLNCQEVDFEKTKSQLEAMAADKSYKVACLGKMPTHTKLSTQLHSGTGIATFVIYRDGLNIDHIDPKIARRENRRFAGRAYNKGGLVTDFSVSDGHDMISVQAVSGHLDSHKITHRNEDWAVVHKASSKRRVNNWSQLASTCPDLKISGYDANTRNKKENDKDEKGISLLASDKADTPEVQALHRAPLGAKQFSSASGTYSKKPSTEDKPKKIKREGYIEGGMLDYVAINDGKKPQPGIVTQDVIVVDPEDSTKRDHKVVISPMQDYDTRALPEFERVRNYIANCFESVDLEMVDRIRDTDETTPDAKKDLMDIYNNYLSKDGLLNKAIDLHTKKLAIYTQLTDGDGAFLIEKEALKNKLAEALFDPNWCDAGDFKITERKQELMRQFIVVLENCHHEAGIEARLAWYTELKTGIENGNTPNVKTFFEQKIQQEYVNSRQALVDALGPEPADNDPNKVFWKAASDVIKQLETLASKKGALSNDMKELDMLTRIANNCCVAYKEITNPTSEKTNVSNALMNLTELNTEVANRSSSPFWNAMNIVLRGFIKAAIVLGRLENTFLNDIENKEKLADKVVNYKKVVDDVRSGKTVKKPEDSSEKKNSTKSTPVNDMEETEKERKGGTFNPEFMP